MKIELCHYDISIIYTALEHRLKELLEKNIWAFTSEEWKDIEQVYRNWESINKESFEKANEETY